jgi:hypothetical protein
MNICVMRAPSADHRSDGYYHTAEHQRLISDGRLLPSLPDVHIYIFLGIAGMFVGAFCLSVTVLLYDGGGRAFLTALSYFSLLLASTIIFWLGIYKRLR